MLGFPSKTRTKEHLSICPEVRKGFLGLGGLKKRETREMHDEETCILPERLGHERLDFYSRGNPDKQ